MESLGFSGIHLDTYGFPKRIYAYNGARVSFDEAFLPLINAARHVAFFVEGAGKAEMLQRVLHGPFDPDVLPAQMIQPADGQLHWLVDAAADGAVIGER